ncbi:MerR family transcriptional regulator [Streptomyces sp. NPDC059875]|uniref:helix-turn-helix domain-containing protein n=1 Tax=unclassified Streptomyces TaxID=2593676 RepID=UPI0036640AAC
MDGETLYSIGELARRTGTTVKTVRFYADEGIVPPADRTPAGHRRFGADAVARIDLVRTLRDFGLGLPAIRKVVDREATLAEVVAAHADALDVQIRTLRLRRAVLTAVAGRGSTPEELDLMHKLARLSAVERDRLIADFLAAAYGALDAGVVRSMTPELPDDPDDAQVAAWVELAELAQDPEFVAGARGMAERFAAAHEGGLTPPRPDIVAVVRETADLALDPASPAARAIVAHVTAHPSCPDDLRSYLEAAADPRRVRYLQLLAVINAWPPPEPLAPALDWFLRAQAEQPQADPDRRRAGHREGHLQRERPDPR